MDVEDPLTGPEIEEALRSITVELVPELTPNIWDSVKPLMPPHGSLVTIGAFPPSLQANRLVAGLTHTPGGMRSRPMPMPTPAAVPRTPFIPRTAQPPYSHVEICTRAELDRPRPTALSAMVDFEHYDYGDSSADEPPSLSPASPSEADDPEESEKPSTKRRKRRGRAGAMRGAGPRRIRLSTPQRWWLACLSSLGTTSAILQRVLVGC